MIACIQHLYNGFGKWRNTSIIFCFSSMCDSRMVYIWRFVFFFMIKTGALIWRKLELPLWHAHAVQNVQADENRNCFICFETFLICLGYIAFIGFCLLIVRKSGYIILIGDGFWVCHNYEYCKCITFGDVFFLAPLAVVSIRRPPNQVHP